jgi:excisionase family DNA binding protein
MSEMDKKLLNVNEAAALLGLGRSLVYSLVMQGKIKSIKIGRSRRIPITALDEFIKQRLEEANGEEW